MKRCDSCGVIEHGKEFDESLSIFRQHLVCSFCHRLWLLEEELLGYEIDFGKFAHAHYSSKEREILEKTRARDWTKPVPIVGDN